MPAMFVFLLKVNIALLLFCAGYYAVLRHLTFYTLNRIYLVGAILFATVYPEINIDNFAQHHQQLTQPVQLMLRLEAPAQTLVAPLARPDYWYWVEVVFWIGATVLAMRLLMQLYSLYKLYCNSTPTTIHGHQVRAMTDDSGPFSFWKSIYVNPDNHHPADLRSILLHEQVHVNQWHTLDILLTEVSTIFYWFNPGIWLMKRAVRENIEFITDAKILKKGIDSKAYQYSLVNVSFASGPQTIVNHFNLSTIKKRIIMMNAKRSSRFNLTRYALLMPLVVVLLLVFSTSKAALVSKSTKALHSIEATINKVNMLSVKEIQTINKSVKPVMILKAEKARLHISADTSVTLSARLDNLIDTGKHTKVSYVIDGKEVDESELNKIVPADIYSVNVTKEGNAGRINIITKNSPLAQKVKSVKFNNYTFVAVGDPLRISARGTGKVDSIRINGHAVADTVVYGSRSLTTIKSSLARMHTLNDVVVTGNPVLATINSTGDVMITGKPITAVRINGVSMSSTSPLNNVLVNGYRSSHSTSVDNLSDKVIVIDGKTANEKEVKKLSVYNIDHLTVKTDEETKSLYGDKAKNGVIFIITKKKK